jgi:outer membrane lipoprotein-sorting protein
LYALTGIPSFITETGRFKTKNLHSVPIVIKSVLATQKVKELNHMRMKFVGITLLMLFLVRSAFAITVDELINKNIEARGGLDKIRAIQSIKFTGQLTTKGRFGTLQLPYVVLMKRPDMYRTEFTLQGMTAIQAFDGRDAWRISPFRGRVDPEMMSADETKMIRINADIDGPLVDYKAKGNTVEYLGTEDVEGTEAHKLKVTFKSGDIRYIYLDPDYFLEIRETDVMRVRGAEAVQETDLGNYEQVNGVYFPFSMDSGEKDGPKDSSITIEKAEANVALDDSLFHFPAKH